MAIAAGLACEGVEVEKPIQELNRKQSLDSIFFEAMECDGFPKRDHFQKVVDLFPD